MREKKFEKGERVIVINGYNDIACAGAHGVIKHCYIGHDGQDYAAVDFGNKQVITIFSWRLIREPINNWAEHMKGLINAS